MTEEPVQLHLSEGCNALAIVAADLLPNLPLEELGKLMMMTQQPETVRLTAESLAKAFMVIGANYVAHIHLERKERQALATANAAAMPTGEIPEGYKDSPEDSE